MSLLESAVSSDQRIAIYWPKSSLLVFIIIVKAWVVLTKTDRNAMNLTKKERRVTDRRRKTGGKNKIPNQYCQWRCRNFILRDSNWKFKSIAL